MPNLPISLLPELTAITSNAEFVVEQSGTTYRIKNTLFKNTYLPISGGTINGDLSVTGGTSVQSLSATTISATTYQNLPSTPFLPLSGGTVTGQVIIKSNSSPLIMTTNNYSPGSSGNILYFTDFTGSTNGKAINSRSSGGGIPGNLILQELNNGNVGVNKNTSDTLNYNLDVNGTFGATSVSATTYQNLPSFLPTSGGTVNGGLSATTFSANTVVVSGITINPKQTIALFFGHDSLSPGDTQTYFIGNAINLTAPITGSDGRRVIIPKTGNIVAVDICQNIGGTLGSSESTTFTINNVTQSTQSTITSSYVYTASSANIFYTLSSPLSVTAGDKIEIRFTTPAWVTNPTTIRQQMNVYLEY